MLSIIIADDEVGIIDLCKMLIEYPNAKVVGEAHNSLELFDKIGELRPNTVITDICMPGMTGLELIEKAKKTYPDVNFIVMSGFTEFKYAQQALRLGVLEYLLKPIQKADLNRILEKLDNQLEETRQIESQQAGIQHQLQESRLVLREKYILDIWKSKKTAPVPVIGDTPILNFEQAQMQCLFLCVDSRFAAKTSEANMLIQRAEGAFGEIQRLISQTSTWSFFGVDGFYGIGFILYPRSDAEELSRQLLKQISSELRRFNDQNGFSKISASASQICEGDHNRIPRLFEQAQTALKWRLEKHDSHVICYQEDDELTLAQVPNFSRTEELKDAVAQKDQEGIFSIITEAWENLVSDKKTPGIRYRLMEELVDCLNEGFRELPGVMEIPEPMKLDFFEILSGSSSRAEISSRIKQNTGNILNKYNDYFAHRENSIIMKAKQYIAKHFAEDLSLNSMAKYVCLSSAYFSTLFKAETGCGFAKYLQKLRVEEAKKLLKNTKMRIGDIALAVGYRDIKSFNKIFVNETQVKPSEYRKFYT